MGVALSERLYLCLLLGGDLCQGRHIIHRRLPSHLTGLPPLLRHSLFMLSLFVVELSSFITSTTHSTVVVDFNRDQQVRSNEVQMGCARMKLFGRGSFAYV